MLSMWFASSGLRHQRQPTVATAVNWSRTVAENTTFPKIERMNRKRTERSETEKQWIRMRTASVTIEYNCIILCDVKWMNVRMSERMKKKEKNYNKYRVSFFIPCNWKSANASQHLQWLFIYRITRSNNKKIAMTQLQAWIETRFLFYNCSI